MDYRFIGLALAVLLLSSGVFAYAGFSGYNRYYYTDNYAPTVYYAAPAYAYSYPAYAYAPNYYRAYYPTYAVVNYVTPAYAYYPAPVVGTYSNISIYGSDDGWGFSFGRGTVCGYYGYC